MRRQCRSRAITGVVDVLRLASAAQCGDAGALPIVATRCTRRLGQHREHRAVVDDIAQRRHARIGSADRNTAKAAALRYVNVVDGGGCQFIPRAQPFQQQTAAMGQRDGPRITAPCRNPAGVGARFEYRDAQPAVTTLSQGQRQRRAHRAAAHDHNVGVGYHAVQRAAISASMSLTVLGAAAVNISQPPAVTTTSSSIRTPMWANSAGTPAPGRI